MTDDAGTPKVGHLEKLIRDKAVRDARVYFNQGIHSLIEHSPRNIGAILGFPIYRDLQNLKILAGQIVDRNAEAIGDNAVKLFLENHTSMQEELAALQERVDNQESRLNN